MPITISLANAVRAALARIADPDSATDIVSAGRVMGLTVRDDAVAFTLEVPLETAAQREPLRLAAQTAALTVPGITRALVTLTAESQAPGPTAPPAVRKAAASPSPRDGLDQVRHIVAVGSGKGGVGKSTIAANLAVALAASGLRVGLADADIYGPSTARLLGLSGKAESQGNRLVPQSAWGISAMSMALLVDPDQAALWRGPMATSALMQLLAGTAWGPLDVLIIDLPPGTGDIHLTLGQKVPLAGAVVVSTPQDLALIDARKAITLFRKMATPLLGIVENMSQFLCPHCQQETPIFGHGGAKVTAEELGVPFLGAVPLEMATRIASDAGEPIVLQSPDSASAKALNAIAAQIRTQLF